MGFVVLYNYRRFYKPVFPCPVSSETSVALDTTISLQTSFV